MSRTTLVSSMAAGVISAGLVIGCGATPSSDGGAVASVAASIASMTSPSPSAPRPAASESLRPETQAPTASASANAPPAELRGIWRTQIGADRTDLTLIPGYYKIARGGAGGGGRIAVTGNLIEFFGSDLCEGSGTYAWVVDGDRLTLTPQDADPCGRASALANVTYTLYAAIP